MRAQDHLGRRDAERLGGGDHGVGAERRTALTEETPRLRAHSEPLVHGAQLHLGEERVQPDLVDDGYDAGGAEARDRAIDRGHRGVEGVVAAGIFLCMTSSSRSTPDRRIASPTSTSLP